MRKTFFILFLVFTFSCGKSDKTSEQSICEKHFEDDSEWQFYMYNSYYNIQEIPILDESGMKVVDSINLFSILFNKRIRTAFEDTTQINVTFLPSDTTKKYIHSYANTLRKSKEGNINYVYTGDRFGYKVTPTKESDAFIKFKEYLINNRSGLHPCLENEAKRRGVFE